MLKNIESVNDNNYSDDSENKIEISKIIPKTTTSESTSSLNKSNINSQIVETSSSSVKDDLSINNGASSSSNESIDKEDQQEDENFLLLEKTKSRESKKNIYPLNPHIIEIEIMFLLLQGLSTMHQYGITHKDIALKNIVVGTSKEQSNVPKGDIFIVRNQFGKSFSLPCTSDVK